MSEDESPDSGDDEITLDLEGAGSADQAQTETVDPGWESSGRESADTSADDQSTTGASTSSDDAAPDTEKQSGAKDTAKPLAECLEKENADLAPYLESAVTPGQYDDLPYVFKRTGKEKVKWDRPSPMRFDVFQEVSDQLDDAHEYFSEEVYPEASVMKADVQMAAMIAGYANPDDMERILDSWGYSDI